MIVGSLNLEVIAHGAHRTLRIAGAPFSVETAVTLPELETLVAELQRDVTRWQQERNLEKGERP